MNPNLEQAIVQFLANEFHVQPEDIGPDTDLYSDFGLDEIQITDLINRIQDALEFSLSEEKIAGIHTVGDLFTCLHPEDTDATL